MQQNQMYQEKNYHITWIASVREEMRDFLTIFVGRLQNTGLLNTLLFGISTAFLCEGELDNEAPDSLVYAYYSSLIISMLYFGCSILFCFIGAASAYAESRKFMLKFVPDVHDAYNFDYISQLLEWETKGEALRVPFVMESKRLAEKRERKKHKEGKSAEPEDFFEKFDRRMKDFNESTKVDYLHKGGTNAHFWGVSPTNESDEERGEGPLEQSFYEIIGGYNLLWEPCSLASHNSMMLGVFALCESFSYFLIGRHMDRSLQDRLGMFATMTIAALAFVGRVSSRLVTVESELDLKGHHIRDEDCLNPSRKLKDLALKLLMLLGPLTVMSGVFLPEDGLVLVGYMSHGALHAYLAFFLLRSFPSEKKQSGLPPARPEKLRRLAQGKGTGSKQEDPELGIQARESPEPMLRQLLFESEKKSQRTAVFMKRLLLNADYYKDGFFRARAITCSQGGRVWLASEDGVFQISPGVDGGLVESVECPDLPLDESVQGLTEQCSESGCWPLVLGSSGRLHSCGPKSETNAPFTQLSGISGIALAGEEFYVSKNHSILHVPSRKAVARPVPGLVGFDILRTSKGDDVFIFSEDKAEAIQVKRAGARELQKWALPTTLPPLRSACAIGNSTVLAAVQDATLQDHPRLLLMKL